MTAVEWLHDKWSNCKEWKWEEIEQWFKQAKEMEKQQIEEAFYCGNQIHGNWDSDSSIYYNETYGSKGGDENFKQFSLYEHKETITSADTITSSQTEISDEEIEKEANNLFAGDLMWSERIAFKVAIKWYREQLKSRQ